MYTIIVYVGWNRFYDFAVRQNVEITGSTKTHSMTLLRLQLNNILIVEII